MRRCVIGSLTLRVEVPGGTWEAPLPARPVQIGSGETCDVRLDVAGVATSHCVLEPLPDGRHVVKDLSSGLPTLVNGIEVQQVSVRPGDVLEIGDARIAIVAPVVAAPAPPELAAAQDDVVRERPRPAAPSATGPARAPRGSGSRLVGPLVGLAAAAVVALSLAFLLDDGGRVDDAAHKRRFDHALDLYRAKDYESARDVFEGLAGEDSAPELVDLYLRRTNTAIRAADAELERYWSQRLDIDLVSIDSLRTVFLQKHGPKLAELFDAKVEKIREAQTAWVSGRVAETRALVDPLLAGEMFSQARTHWLDLERMGRAGANPGSFVKAGLADIEARAEASATRLLAEASNVCDTDGPGIAMRRVRSNLSRFTGTAAYARLEEATEAYDAQARAAAASSRTPETPGGTDTTPEVPTPETAGAEARREVEAALAKADDAAAAWGFVVARKSLLEVRDLAPERTELRDRIEDRLRDLELAGSGVQALIAAIAEHPERFRRIEMGSGFTVALLRADEKKVTGAVRGGTTEYRWTALPSARVAGIAKRTRATGDGALGLASLLRELGEMEAVEAFLFAAGEGGVAHDVIFPLVARWRGEDVPARGYVAHEDRWVTPEERERLLLLARIADAVRRVRHREPAVWTAAAEELLAMGPEARTPLIDALQARRGDVVDALAELRVFTSSRTKGKLYDELVKRRAHALALIRDARAWPYPNPTKQNTDEVDARVDKVREVWERPFDVIIGWSKEAREELSRVSQVDEYLVRADPDFRPSLDDVRAKVNQAVNMPEYTPDGKARSTRAYSLKVLAFNVKVPTTATHEEKDCVRVVNEYRMMMGHRAVKINERLVRAARGHSRHMRENEYFAHNVPANKGPTDANRTPGHRARTQGYGSGVGENIARGTWSGRDAFSAWFHSSGHHRNMINKGWREMGAGRSGGVWWTQLFGSMSGTSLDVPPELPEPDAAFAAEPETPSGRPTQPGAPELPDEPPVIPPDWPGDEEEGMPEPE